MDLEDEFALSSVPINGEPEWHEIHRRLPLIAPRFDVQGTEWRQREPYSERTSARMAISHCCLGALAYLRTRWRVRLVRIPGSDGVDLYLDSATSMTRDRIPFQGAHLSHAVFLAMRHALDLPAEERGQRSGSIRTRQCR